MLIELTQSKLTKGEIYIADLKSYYKNSVVGQHPVILMSNFLCLQFSQSLQVVPITSQDKHPMEAHIFISKDFGLDYDSTALCEQLTTIDRACLINKLGQLSDEVLAQVDRAISLQLNNSRHYNIQHAIALAKYILELERFAKKYELDESDIRLKDNLEQELKSYCKQYNINYTKLFEKMWKDEKNA